MVAHRFSTKAGKQHNDKEMRRDFMCLVNTYAHPELDGRRIQSG